MVTQSWKHNTLETDAGANYETLTTDVNGYVAFPERTIKASLLRRIVLTVFSAFMTLAHGSFGVDAYIIVAGENVADYKPSEPLPEQIIVPHH